jgi:hypothetical protein
MQIVNKINDKYSVQYSQQRLVDINTKWGGYTVEELDARGIFVNGNYADVKCKSQKKFEQKFEFDRIDDGGSPVYIYLQGDTMVAWYDTDREEGFIA